MMNKKLFYFLLWPALIVTCENVCDGEKKCVPINHCRLNKTDEEFVNNELIVLSPEEVEESRGGCHYLETCCALDHIVSKEKSQSQIIENMNTGRINQCIQQCRVTDSPFGNMNIPEKINNKNFSPLGWNCGHSNSEGIGFQVPETLEETGVSNAQFGEFPWHLALIEKLENNDRKYLCGASLINPSVALTAAHCLEKIGVKKLIVRAGEWDTQTTNEPFPHVNHELSRVVIHPNFNSSNMHNGIALLFLETPINLTVHINTICLPPKNIRVDHLTECYGTGWGVDEFFMTGYFRANLKKIRLPIVQKGNCQKLLRSTKLSENFKLDPSFLCAGGKKNRDMCSGDGGGGLICRVSNDKNVFVQVGKFSKFYKSTTNE